MGDGILTRSFVVVVVVVMGVVAVVVGSSGKLLKVTILDLLSRVGESGWRTRSSSGTMLLMSFSSLFRT